MEFMERKAAMEKTVAQVLAGGEGSRSIRGKMSALLAKIEQEKLATLEDDPNNTIKTLEAADKALQVQLEAREGIKHSGWADFEAKIQATIGDIKHNRVAAEAQLSAVGFMANLHKKSEKSNKNSVYYRRRRPRSSRRNFRYDRRSIWAASARTWPSIPRAPT